MKVTKLTLAEVFEAARSKNLGDPGRAIRMEKKADGKLEIGTWNAAKGHDWNPLKGYLEKKALVKGLEKEIGKIFDDPRVGKELTKQAGAYKRTFFSNALPKLTGKQVLDLEEKVNARLAEKRSEAEQMLSKLPLVGIEEQHGKSWSGSIQMNQESTATFQNDLKDVLNSEFTPNNGPANFDDKFLINDPLLSITLVQDQKEIVISEVHKASDLKKLNGKTLEDALTLFAIDYKTKRNLLTVLVQVTTESFDATLYKQEKFDLRSTNKINELECKIELKNDEFVIDSLSTKTVDQLTIDDADEVDPQNIPLNEDGSRTFAFLRVGIPGADIERGSADNLRVVGEPSVDCVAHPAIFHRDPHPDL